MKKRFVLIILVTALLSLEGCSKIKKEKVTRVTSSDSLYVRKIENVGNDFIMGMDCSAVISLENAGVRYYDYDGSETDVFRVLAENGINYIRVRVWNDPYDSQGRGYGGGNCDINNALEIGKRATKYGMKLLVDFHYSDFWADPGKQMVPKAWKGMSIEEKGQALYEFTRDSLKLLKDEGVDVGMVQLGNETNGALCGEKSWMNIVYHLMANGSKAVREIYPKALVAVHFSNPEKVTNYADYAKKLDYYSLDYDVFASSYYPYWHGTLDNLTTVLNDITDKYGKKTMIMETSYAYTNEDSDLYGNTISDSGAIVKNYPFTVQGQANCMMDIIDTVANKLKAGIGICYWEGTWIAAGGNSYEENRQRWEKYGCGWAASYAREYDPNDAGKYYGGCAVDNQAFFDSKGHPIESLKVFELVKKGNENVKPTVDAVEDVSLIVDLNGEIILPEKVNAVMSDNSKQLVEVKWQEIDREKMKNSGPAVYDIIGQVDGMTAHCYVSMIEFNFLNNYSFEDDKNGETNPQYWTVKEYGRADELYVEDKSTDSLTGSKHFHFWSGSSNTVEFEIYQNVENLPSGRYKYSISIMGGDAGETQCYAYVRIDGKIIEQAELVITSYNDWHTAEIKGFDYRESQKLEVGIYVKCEGQGNGAWGKIDDALLNSMSE